MAETHANIKTSIECLLKLQEIDSKIFLLNQEKVTPSESYSKAKAALDEADRVLKIAEKTLRENERDRRGYELRSMTMQEDLKKAETKRRDLRNTKDEFGASKEVETLQKRLAEVKKGLEDRTPLVAEKTTIRDQRKEVFDQKKGLFDTEEKARSERLQAVDQELEALLKQRSAYISQVDEDIFVLYERVQKIRRGSGVALVRSTICSGCFVTIPPQALLKIERFEEVLTCPSCSRILFSDISLQSASA